jgi:signal transduction histidine kinase
MMDAMESTAITQHLWDQMRTDMGADELLKMQTACQSLLSGQLGALADQQKEDLQSVDRALLKLARRIEGEPINWSDDSEAAHALRGPLNSTLGFSRLILKGLDGPVNKAQREAVQAIYGASRRLLVHFNLLLDATFLIKNELSLDLELFRLGDLLDELVALGDGWAKRGGFSFAVDVEAAAHQVMIHSNAKRLKEALVALMTAAVKCGPAGSVGLGAWLEADNVMLTIENQECRLPPSFPVDLSTLLTASADRSLPYDLHLNIGVAWHLLDRLNGQLTVRQTDGASLFAVSLALERAR